MYEDSNMYNINLSMIEKEKESSEVFVKINGHVI